MCGIIGYIGDQSALPILIEGLKALEYRGYDSAGVVIVSGDKTILKKSVGRVEVLHNSISKHSATNNHVGIGHTRWATHGAPSTINAHPHADCRGSIFVVHNGIIENYQEIKAYLIKKGHHFKSETDSEVLPHLIEDFLSSGKSFDQALYSALKSIRGAYAFAILDKNNPQVIYAAKVSSPMVIGVGKNENFIASDPSALIGHTKKVIYLKDNQVAKISASQITLTNQDREAQPIKINSLEWNLSQTQKGKYPHFMLKEIHEGAAVVKAACLGRVKLKQNLVKLGGLDPLERKLKKIKRLIILACGTSYYAGLIGEYFLEEIAGLPTEVHLASEFRYRQEPLASHTAVIVISQSGETADTLAALKKAKACGLITLGIVNVVGSTIARETDAGVYNHAGPEIGVASTKAFLSQLTVLLLIAIYLADDKKLVKKYLTELEKIPQKITTILKLAPKIKKLAVKYQNFPNFFFLGRRFNFPVALEGALKLKEISYTHAEGYGAGELKHGPIALISPKFPTLIIAPQNQVIDKMIANLQEIKARKGPVLAITTQGNKRLNTLADDVIYIPATLEPFEPFLTVIPLQLLAYYIGTLRGIDVDKPRNLAKSVTVE